MSKHTEVVVIGSGPGGYVAAIRAAFLGKQVTVVEKEYIGGVCLNVGCIPSKAMITAGHKYAAVKEYPTFGLEVPEIHVDWDKVQDYRANSVKQLTDGIQTLLEGNGIDIIRGEARFADANSLEIDLEDGGQETLTFDHCIIATGSRPKDIPPVRFSDKILSSTEVLSLPEIPEKMIVIGGGVIGIELATVYANFGTEVTILEGMKNILPSLSPKLTRVVKKNLTDKGVQVITNAMVQGSQEDGDTVTISAEIKGEVQDFTADCVLLSIGRNPNTDDIGLDKAGLEVNDWGLIPVDDQCRTQVDHIYAIGDIIEGPQLAHKASFEAKVAAEAICGQDSKNSYRSLPSVVFSEPEVAVTGLTVKEAKEQGLDAKAYSFQYAANGRAIAMNETDGYVSITADEDTGRVLGAEIVGANASDLISELSLAVEQELTVGQVAETIHPHPTLGEIVMETAEFAHGTPIHTISK